MSNRLTSPFAAGLLAKRLLVLARQEKIAFFGRFCNPGTRGNAVGGRYLAHQRMKPGGRTGYRNVDWQFFSGELY